MHADSRHDEFLKEIEPHRRTITLHCYRMLGSLQDAEEVAQESLLRAWQRLGERRSAGSTRSWLYKIATNACLDVLRVRRRRTLPHLAAALKSSGSPEHEELWIEPAPDSLLEVVDDATPGPEAQASIKESISLAFIAALQRLSPKQRAALLLVDVIGCTPQEAGQLLETTTISVSSLLQRARKNIASRDVPALEFDDALLKRYIATWENGDLDAFTTLLAEDALLSMPPRLEWYSGREAIRGFLEATLKATPRRFRLVPVAASGSAAVAVYTAPPAGGDFEPAAITVLSMRDGRITKMIRFAMPPLFRRFGLPDSLAADAPKSVVDHVGR